MKQAAVSTINHMNTYRAFITMACMVACAICAVVYMVNLYSLVSRTVAIGSLEKKIVTLTSSLADLDAEYLRLSNTVTPENIHTYGLTTGRVSFYITRTPSTAYNARETSQGVYVVRNEF